MANTQIKLKANTTSAGAVPGAGVIAVGELALNTVDKVLYSKAANGTVVIVGTGADSQNVATQISVGANVIANTTALFVGNSTVNAIHSQTQYKLANSTVSLSITLPTAAQVTAANYYLNANGSWVVVTGGSGSPTGSNTAIQFNDSGAFGGNLDFTWNKTTDAMALGNSTVTTSPSLKLQNSTVSFTMTIPTSTQAAATNYFLCANGSWLTVTGGGGATSVMTRQNFTGNGTTNTYAVTAGYSSGQIDVYLNGIKLLVGTDVTASNGTHIQLASNAANNDVIEVVGYSNVTISGAVAGSDKFVQFNDGGIANAVSSFQFVKSQNAIVVGTSTTPDAMDKIRVNDNANSYVQIQVKNANSGVNASGDLVFTSDSGNDSVNFLDIGINSSTYANASVADGPNDAYLFTQNSSIYISTSGANDIIFSTSGLAASAEKMRIKAGGGIQITGQTTIPTAPSGNNLVLFNKAISGRTRLAQVGTSGIDYTFQPFLGANRVAWTNQVDNVALPTALNMAIANTLAFTARAMSTANLFMSTRRTGVASNTTAGTSAEARGSTRTQFMGSASGLGGFYVVIRAGVSVVAAQGRAFIGMSNSSVVLANANPSTFTNMIGFGYDSAATNWSIMSANATTSNVVSLGTGFPCGTGNTNMYDFHIFAKPNSATCNYAVVNLLDGNTVNGTFNPTNIPVVNTLLGWKVWVNNGSTAGIHAVDVASVYLEMDNSS